MKEDLFDKKIKDKFNQIDKPVGEEVWSNIKKKLPLPWWLLFFKKYALPFYASLVSGLLLYSYFQNSKHEREFKDIRTELAELNIKNNNTTTIDHRDTIYIEKTIYVRNVPQTTLTFSTIDKLEKQVNNLRNKIEEYVTLTEKSKDIGNSTSQETKSESVNLVASEKTNEVVSKKDDRAIIEQKLDSLLMPQRQKKIEETSETEPTKQKFSLPKIESRFGLTGGYTSSQSVFFGPQFEYFVNKALSFSVGAQINNFHRIEYAGTKNFLLETGKDFMQLFGSQLLNNEVVKDIYLKNTAIELPLMLNYYIPLRPKLDLMINYGTHLDINNYQSLEVEYQIDDSHQKLQTKGGREWFHNMILGTGIQYRNDKYIFKIGPSYVYNFRESPFKKAGSVLGLQGGIYLKLNK